MNFNGKPLLVIGIIVIVVALLSWFLIPAWRNTPGGFFVLLGAVILGVLAASKDTVELLNGLRNMRKAEKQDESEPRLPQTAKASGNRSVAVIGDVNGSIQTGGTTLEKAPENQISKQAKKKKK